MMTPEEARGGGRLQAEGPIVDYAQQSGNRPLGLCTCCSAACHQACSYNPSAYPFSQPD